MTAHEAALLQTIQYTLTSDVALLAVVQDSAIRIAGAASFAVPAVEYSIVDQLEQETQEVIRVQIDCYAYDLYTLATMEGRVRALLSKDTPMEFGGEKMWALYAGGRELSGPQDGAVNHSFDILFSVVRTPGDRNPA